MLTRQNAFSVFAHDEPITVSRLGKRVSVKGKDGTFQEADSVEANLLYEILKQLKKK